MFLYTLSMNDFLKALADYWARTRNIVNCSFLQWCTAEHW